ncbi:MAG: septation protein A [Gammaproteobacteria bacterium]|nr:septation protein A [Gammaproteobacteria bacterium]
MKLLFDFLPLLLFFATFSLYGIYVATAVAIVASVLQVAWFWLKHRRFETTHLITLAVVTVFGGLTIALHDDTFIKWKPTVVNWIFAALVLGSQLFGKKTALEFLLGSQLELPASIWRNVNLSWGIFFLALGAINLYVAFYYGLDMDPETRTQLWVKFKVFGMLGLTLAFSIIQMLFIAKHVRIDQEHENQ